MEFCVCTGDPRNTGAPSKQQVVSTAVMLIAVFIKADDGTKNVIDKEDTLNEAYFAEKINHEDPTKRWYPLGRFVNASDVRADAATESYDDGSSGLTQQGVRTYTGKLLNVSPAYLGVLESFKCTPFGFYLVNVCGAIDGSLKKDGSALKPVEVNTRSFNPQLVKGLPTESGGIMLSFEFAQIEKDKNLRSISEDEIEAEVLDLEGLIDLDAAITGVTTTEFAAALTVNITGFKNPEKVKGWDVASFKLKNVTTNSDIVITSTTEAPEGTYGFVYPAQTSNDVLRLTVDGAEKPGFYIEELITIP